MARVLVVEDERIVAKDLERTLKRLGHQVLALAASAEDAIRMAEEHQPDLVLMDIHLGAAPDGIAAAAELRSRMNVAVVYLTAYADDDTVRRASETEPYGYLVKPFNERELHSTVEVALYKHRKEAQARQQDRMISLGALAAGVAHEINNPLAYVMVNLGFVSREIVSVTEELRAISDADLSAPIERLRGTRQAMDDAAEGTQRVRAIVADLRGFSRPDETRRASVDLWNSIETAIRLSWSQIRHRAELVREPGTVPLVHANAARLEQALVNILINAAQAIPEGDARAQRILVSTRTDAEQRAVVEIADTGKGIAPEDLPHIFEPFFTTKPVGLGTGLGLSISRKIIVEMGGDIEAESDRERGTVFRITLPPATFRPGRPSSIPAPGGPLTRRARILAIDDEPRFRAILERILGREHDVTVVESAAAGLALFAAGERFDLVLCDLMMPVMNGMELFEAVQEVAEEQTRRFVFLTAGVTTPQGADFLQQRLASSIAKPFTYDELQSVVDAQLRKLA